MYNHLTQHNNYFNLLKHYVKQVYKVEDVTDSYVKYVKEKFNRDYEPKEPTYKVYLKEDCEGAVKNVEQVWAKSYYEEVMKKGYYLG